MTMLFLCVFARDIPRPTGARSAPYENLRVLRAFVVNPTFLILVAAEPRCVSVVNISSQKTQKNHKKRGRNSFRPLF
jgi:hypothetical protein